MKNSPSAQLVKEAGALPGFVPRGLKMLGSQAAAARVVDFHPRKRCRSVRSFTVARIIGAQRGHLKSFVEQIAQASQHFHKVTKHKDARRQTRGSEWNTKWLLHVINA